MKKFEFRLQKVLDFRRLVEESAREAFLKARADRLEAEREAARIANRRRLSLQSKPIDLEDRLALDRLMGVFDEREARQRVVIQDSQLEEERLHAEWQERKVELESLAKLRDAALRDWTLESTRFEQRALDEWASLRRAV
jgi:flagellar export protein FliJ